MIRPLLVFLVIALAPAAGAASSDLPVIEVPPRTTRPDQPLLVMLTGDGGWAEFVRRISTELAADGWPVAGLDLRKYLWQHRTPEEAAAAVDQLIREYGAKWQRSRVVVAGFSRGADIAAFIVNRLPEATRDRVGLVVLLSPGPTAEFEFHLLDFVRDPREAGQLPVVPELLRLKTPALVLYGRNDSEALNPPPDSGSLRSIGFPGDHHLDHEYGRILAAIRGALPAALAPPAPAAADARQSVVPTR